MLITLPSTKSDWPGIYFFPVTVIDHAGVVAFAHNFLTIDPALARIFPILL